jgi:uncharacterized membrane protein YkoI
MNKHPLSLAAAAAALLALAAGPALAHPYSTPLHRCVNAALAKKPGKVLEVELETEDGRQIYEIDIAGKDGKRWELECDLETNRIVKVELEEDDDDDDDDDKSKAKPRAAGGPGVGVISPQPIYKVSEAKAKEIALGQYPGEISGVTYEYSNGRPGYEIHIRSAKGTRIEVEIDGISGEVLEVSEKPR